jgi:hypothetical protein
MVTVLITSFLLLAAISYAIYRQQRASSGESEGRALPPPPRAHGLFGEDDSDADTRERLKEAERHAASRREALLGRAAEGDKSALQEASDDAALYDAVLDALAARADSYQKLVALVSYIERSERPLRVNAALAEKFLDAWKASPEKSRTAAIALHVSATADSAPVYQSAVEAAFACWQSGQLPDITAEELRALFDGEYWVLSSESRNSGAGFVLKQKLASLRLQLLKASSKSTR